MEPFFRALRAAAAASIAPRKRMMTSLIGSALKTSSFGSSHESDAPLDVLSYPPFIFSAMRSTNCDGI